jgi:hypothetical protein
MKYTPIAQIRHTEEIENTVVRNLKALGIAIQVLHGFPEALNEFKKKVSALEHKPEEGTSNVQEIYQPASK